MDSSTKAPFIPFCVNLPGLAKGRVAITFALLTVVEVQTPVAFGSVKRRPGSVWGPAWPFGPIGWLAFARPDRGLSEMLAGRIGGGTRSNSFGVDTAGKECRG